MYTVPVTLRLVEPSMYSSPPHTTEATSTCPSSRVSSGVKVRASEDKQSCHTSKSNVKVADKCEPAVIVLPLDTSEHSRYTLHFYHRFLHRPCNKVYACYVAEDFGRRSTTNMEDQRPAKKKLCGCLPWGSSGPRVSAVGPSPGMVLEQERKDQMNIAMLKASVLRILPDVDCEFKTLKGNDTAKRIIIFSKEVNCTMIMIGSRGEGAVKRHLHGSVSKSVLEHSHLPVLVVRMPEGHAHASSHHELGTTIH